MVFFMNIVQHSQVAMESTRAVLVQINGTLTRLLWHLLKCLLVAQDVVVDVDGFLHQLGVNK